MKLFSRPKRLIFIFLILAVITSLLGLLYFQTVSNFNVVAEPVKFEFIDNHSSYRIRESLGFDSTKLDVDTLSLFKENNIKSVKVTFTDQITPIATSIFDQNGNPINYLGYDIQLEEENFKVSLYINEDAVNELGVTGNQLTIEVIQQMYVSINQLEIDIKTNWQPTQDLIQASLNEWYSNASEKAQNLFKDNEPFTITVE